MNLQRARQALHVQFLTLGVIAAAFGVHVPSVRAHYGLDDRMLSFSLLSAAVGAVLCLVFAGRWIARFGVRPVVGVSAAASALALVLLLQFDRWPALLAVMLLFGAAVGLFDVAINTEGTFIEAQLQRKVMSTLHGMWSLGGMAGALVGAWWLDAGVTPRQQLCWVAAAGVLVAWLAAPAMLPRHAPANDEAAERFSRMASAPRRALVVLGVLALLALVAEGAIYDWTTLYLQRERAASPSVAALGLAGFSAAMALGRFSGDRLRERVAPAPLLAGSAGLAAAAMSAVLLTSGPAGTWVAVAGFAFVGLGMANTVPLLFVAASRVPGASAAAGIALVSSMGWMGIVLGPPIVGALSQAQSLGAGLAVVVAASLVLAVCARQVDPVEPSRAQEDGAP